MVCSAGACVSCTAGLACTPANPCHAGTQMCSPTITCADTGRNLANGAACGTNMVCNNGTCSTCVPGVGCQPVNACKTGTSSCVTGVPVCVDTGNVPNGTMCGVAQVCNNGACGDCMPGGACSSNPGICKIGMTSCATGTTTCIDGGNKAAGSGCG